MTRPVEPAPRADPVVTAGSRRFAGKRAAMVTFSSYPDDPRPRRAVDALVREGTNVDLVCLGSANSPRHEILSGINVLRIGLEHHRGGKLAYVFNYAVFILISSAIFALRSLTSRYDLFYVHNMPDILVLSALIPKALGAKVILDMHDPMPELMTTIFNFEKDSLSVRLISRIEKWSLARADLVITVNVACKRIFSSRSCRPEKIAVVMNSPDGTIFPFRVAQSYSSAKQTPNKRFVVMYHGSLVERNGLEVAIDALERVRRTVPTIELHIFGAKTHFLDRMMRKVRENNLQDHVRNFGPKRLEDLVTAIGSCDIGVIPNHRNVFTEINTPTRIFEYLALGKPVIAPSTPGILDYFNEESLLFFEPGSSNDLAQKIEYAYSHPSEVLDIARKGQQVYLEHMWSQERQTLGNQVSGLLNGR